MRNLKQIAPFTFDVEQGEALLLPAAGLHVRWMSNP
jgi:hypothetical protein